MVVNESKSRQNVTSISYILKHQIRKEGIRFSIPHLSNKNIQLPFLFFFFVPLISLIVSFPFPCVNQRAPKKGSELSTPLTLVTSLFSSINCFFG